MKITHLLAAFATTALAATLCSCSQKVDTTNEISAMDYVQTLGLGWNLGNSLDAHQDGVANETCWHDQAATQATFDAVKKAGYGCVRIPVTWLGQVGEAPE